MVRDHLLRSFAALAAEGVAYVLVGEVPPPAALDPSDPVAMERMRRLRERSIGSARPPDRRG